MTVLYEWRSLVGNEELEALHAEGFGHEPTDFDRSGQIQEHSLGWVCARDAGRLVGFVNVAWDGGSHAFILDTLVAAAWRRRRIGSALVLTATREAAAAGCEWLHVDFEDHLRDFYIDTCGFVETNAGIKSLRTA
jgi:GNAT superfamily N-acetyltransferase